MESNTLFNRATIYLRKSRSDEEIERTLGQGETLRRHRNTLLEFSKKNNINIIQVHEEMVSGESILQRPVMLKLLAEIEQGLYDAVLVMDIDRLGRGDMRDQGTILETFKLSNTRIITPDKTYDLNNEFDEEYTEFEAFMARKEYKMINKRLQRGVIRSVNDGKYMSPRPPYGYNIKEDKHFRSLEPNPEQAEIIKMIFDLYVNHNYGSNTIAKKLNDMSIKTLQGNNWSSGAISYIIKNPVYIGKVSWKKVMSYKTNGKNKVKRVKARDEWIISEGIHKPIIDVECFYKAQYIISNKIKPPVKSVAKYVNSLAGLVICKVCGQKMQFRSYNFAQVESHILCKSKCGNKSSKYTHVERIILLKLKEYINEQAEYIPENIDNNTAITLRSNIKELENELSTLAKQKNNSYDLLEQKVYDIDVFLDRTKNIAERMEYTKKALDIANIELENEIKLLNNKVNAIPNAKNILETYENITDIHKKNMLLKELLYKVEYLKHRNQREDNFEIWLYPKI